MIELEDKTSEIDISNNPTLGDADAPIQIVEFGDFRCPACKDFSNFIIPSLEEDFINSGKASYTQFNYPFLANDSFTAAEFGISVYETLGTEAFFEYNNDLTSNEANHYTKKYLTKRLKKLFNKEDVDNVLDFYNNKSYEESLNNDLNLVEELGVNSTPSVFINGKYFPNALDYNNLKYVIEKELNLLKNENK